MYEVRISDDESEQILAVHDTIAAAMADVDRIVEATRTQLNANGEGHNRYWLQIVIRDSAGESIVASTGTSVPTTDSCP